MQPDTRLCPPLRRQSSLSSAASHQCLWDIAAAWFFSRHNRFAETHSLLQRSYHITDRLLAAGNYRIFWHYENEELSLFTYFECLNVSSCAECVYWWYIYINIINYNLSCYYVNQVTQLLTNFVFVFITFFTLMSNKYINSEQSQPNSSTWRISTVFFSFEPEY